jgi:hypothetical protein
LRVRLTKNVVTICFLSGDARYNNLVQTYIQDDQAPIVAGAVDNLINLNIAALTLCTVPNANAHHLQGETSHRGGEGQNAHVRARAPEYGGTEDDPAVVVAVESTSGASGSPGVRSPEAKRSCRATSDNPPHTM